MIKPAKRKTLHEEISKQIISMIRNESWKPGEKIPGEIELSHNFEVSRNSVRESIKALELVGVLSSRSGRGTFVSETAFSHIATLQLGSEIDSESKLREIMEARAALEPGLVALAVRKATEEDILLLEQLLKDCINSVEEKNYDFSKGFEFHRTIFRIANNLFLNSILDNISQNLIAVRKIIFFKHVNNKIMMEELMEHQKILDLIKERDEEKAMISMRNHINNSFDRVLPIISTQKT